MQTVLDFTTVVGIGERIIPHVQGSLDKLGFIYDASTDTLTTPEGWSIYELNDSSGVIERNGITRGGWGYGSPTRVWRLEFLRRHDITYEQPEYFDGYIWYKSRVKDILTGEVISPVFTCSASAVRVHGDSDDHQRAVNDAYGWLKEHFPETHDPTAYWDE